MLTFTLYWRFHKREVVQGETIAQAMTLAGYSNGAVRALDFYANGDDESYVWNGKEWKRKPLEFA